MKAYINICESVINESKYHHIGITNILLVLSDSSHILQAYVKNHTLHSGKDVTHIIDTL